MMIFGHGEFAQVLKQKLGGGVFVVDSEFMKEGTDFVNRYEDVVFWLKHERPNLPIERRMVMGIGPSDLNSNRERIFGRLKTDGFIIEEYIDPSSTVNGFHDWGCVILEQVNIQHYSSLGENVVVWSQSHIGHHSRIGSHTFITSHVCVSGGAQIGERCFLGCGVVIKDHITIGNRCLITPNSYVDRDIPDDSVWRGDQLLRVKSDQVKL